MKHVLPLLLLFLLIYACKPEQTVPSIDESFSRTQKISLDYGDSVIYFRIAEKNEIEADFAQKYTWFSRDTIMTTQGQFRGRLLEGEFEVLRQKDRTLIRKGEYAQGLKHGKWIKWFPNGNIESAYTYEDGVLEGDFLRQQPSGEPMQKGSYKNGALDGNCQYFEGSGLSMTITYKKGVPTDTLP